MSPDRQKPGRVLSICAGISLAVYLAVSIWIQGFRIVSVHPKYGLSYRWYYWDVEINVSQIMRVPWGALTLPLLILPIYWLWKRMLYRQWERSRVRVCKRCGYDLRASTGRCPECGEPDEALASPD